MFDFCGQCGHFHWDSEVCVPDGEFCEYSDCCIDGDWVRPAIGDSVEMWVSQCETQVGILGSVTRESYVISGVTLERKLGKGISKK